MTSFIASQILAGLATCFEVTSFQFKERRKALACLVCAAYLIAIHFVILDRTTAALLVFISGTRVLTGFFSRRKAWMVFYLAVTIIAFFATYNSPISILPFISGVLATWAVFQASDTRLRLAYMTCSSLWLIHNVYVGTPGAAILEGLFFTSSVIGYWRHYPLRLNERTGVA